VRASNFGQAQGARTGMKKPRISTPRRAARQLAADGHYQAQHIPALMLKRARPVFANAQSVAANTATFAQSPNPFDKRAYFSGLPHRWSCRGVCSYWSDG
jgi:hypothetical protein